MLVASSLRRAEFKQYRLYLYRPVLLAGDLWAKSARDIIISIGHSTLLTLSSSLLARECKWYNTGCLSLADRRLLVVNVREMVLGIDDNEQLVYFFFFIDV